MHCSFECSVILFSDIDLTCGSEPYESTQTVVAMLIHVVWAWSICLGSWPPPGHRKCPTVHNTYRAR